MEPHPFTALLLITGLAVAVPLLFSHIRRVQLPIVVGEILAGIAIGHSGLNLVAESAVLEFLAEFGFAFLMFLSGFEIDFNLIAGAGGNQGHRWWAQPVPLSLLMLAGTIAMATLASLGLWALDLVGNPVLMGLIMSTTSLGIVAPVLKERRLLVHEYGQMLLVAASLADFVTLLLLTIVIGASSQGISLDLLLIPVLLVVFVLVAQVGRRFARVPGLSRLLEELSHATAQVRVRGALALLVAWAVLAEFLGVELILGAFLAGAIVSLTSGPNPSQLREKLDAVGFGFFIPIFFIMVGTRFDLSAITRSPRAMLLVPLLLIIAYAVKLVPALLLRLRFGWRETLAAGMLLSARLSLIIAAAAIALQIGAITEAVSNAAVLIAIVTCTLSPLGFNRLYKPGEEAPRRGVILVGADAMTEMLALRLQHHFPITIVSRDPALAGELRQASLAVVEGNPSDEAALAQAGAADAGALMFLAEEQDVMLKTCALARERFAIPRIIARTNDAQLTADLSAQGVRVVQPVLATAMALEGALRFPTTFDLLVDKEDNVEIGEAVVTNSRLIGKALRQVRLPGGALILSIHRDGLPLVPHGDTVLGYGDNIALIGTDEAIADASAMLAADT